MKFFKINSAFVFLWIGFVCAISFMEAWLKFRAPGVTLGLGLGIGKLVFSTLNKIEWLLAIIILFYIIQSRQTFWTKTNAAFFVPVTILALQSFWILPRLSIRADLIIAGKTPEASFLHFYYVGLEILKIMCLSYFGIKLLKSIK